MHLGNHIINDNNLPNAQEHERRRLAALRSYAVLDTPAESEFDEIVQLAADICQVPIALISLIDDSRQWLKAKVGTQWTEISKELSFCQHTVQAASFLEIEDARLDQRFADIPLVTNAPNIKYYAGAPLISPDGYVVGTISVLNTSPQKLTETQIKFLQTISKNVVSQLELRKKNSQLVDAKELLELVTETNDHYIFAKDSDFRIVLANSAFRGLYPQSQRENIIGYTTFEEYQQKDVDEFLEQDRIAFKTGRSETLEKIHFPNGEIRTLSTTKTRFIDSHHQSFILGVSHDVTERETLIEKLRRSNEELDEFAYIASHDLKAPLTAIKRLASWIEQDCANILPAESVKHFDMLKSRVVRMEKLLNDLLSFSRLSRIEQHFTQLNLRTVVQGCAELLDLPVAFQLEVEDVEVFFPQLPLEIMLTNLISNAIKHHHRQSGKIEVSCELTADRCLLKVRDDGPGIDPAYHQKVFNKFKTLKPRDEIEGSGLGLSMVKKVIEQLSGSVEVVSDGKAGTTIVLSWPVAKAT